MLYEVITGYSLSEAETVDDGPVAREPGVVYRTVPNRRNTIVRWRKVESVWKRICREEKRAGPLPPKNSDSFV